MYRLPSCLTAIALLLLSVPTPLSGQTLRQRWGVTVDVSPAWTTPSYQAALMNAEHVEMRGAELQLGLTRGRVLGGDWSLSFVRRSIQDRDDAIVKSDGTVLSTRGDTLLGLEISGFKPLGTIKQRAQIGLTVGAGVGRYRGTVIQSRTGSPPDIVDAGMLFSFERGPAEVVPLGRVELTGAVSVAARTKVRVSGGVGFPGHRLLGIGLTQFF